MNQRHSPSSADEAGRLLLYTLDELPAHEAADIERRLAAGGSLQQQLTAIQEEVNAADTAFAALDQDNSVNVNRAVLRATSAVHQWQAQRKQAGIVKLAARGAPRGWKIAAVAAAVAALAAIPVVKHLTRPNTSHLAEQGPGLPNFTPEQEERIFHMGQLEVLANGSSGAEGEAPGELPSSALPAMPVDDGAITGVASATTAGEPFFDVPLSPDDAGR